jgi:hypothetical protein
MKLLKVAKRALTRIEIMSTLTLLPFPAAAKPAPDRKHSAHWFFRV